MAISPDILRAIEIIDQRIVSLQKIKEMIVKEFGGEEIPTSGQPQLFASIPSAVVAGPKKTQKEVLVDFLRTHGPATRSEIMTKANMPKGTIAFLLNQKQTFMRLDDRRWTVK
jgi:hypothetical protein